MCAPDDSADGDLTNDERLARKVRFSLNQSRLSGLRLIDVELLGGTVVLRGTVTTFHQKQLATALIQKVAGVVEVTNLLEVSGELKDDKPRPAIGLYRQNGASRGGNGKPI